MKSGPFSLSLPWSFREAGQPRGDGARRTGGETVQTAHTPYPPAREGCVCEAVQGRRVSAGNAMEMVAKFGGVCVGPCARVCSGSLLGAQCPPGVVTGAEERNEEAGAEGWKDRQRGRRARLARRGTADTLLACLSVSHSAPSGTLVGRAPSPPPPRLERDPSRASTLAPPMPPHPTRDPQPTCAGRAPILPRGVSVRVPPPPTPSRAKLGRSAL